MVIRYFSVFGFTFSSTSIVLAFDESLESQFFSYQTYIVQSAILCGHDVIETVP
jgi:hypothetical protein